MNKYEKILEIVGMVVCILFFALVTFFIYELNEMKIDAKCNNMEFSEAMQDKQCIKYFEKYLKEDK